MEIKHYYYACLKRKDGTIIRVKFDDRRKARDYISDNYDELEHTACWTE